MENSVEELIKIIYPFVQQIDIGTRHGKWLVNVFDKKWQFWSSGICNTLDEALLVIGIKIKAIVDISL